MPIIIKEHKSKTENKKTKFSLHKSPLFQKLLIVVLFTAAVSVVYARAATNIGNNIITDGTLTVTGTTTLSSILSVNDINMTLASGGNGITIAGDPTGYSGIHFADNFTATGIYFSNSNGNHSPFIYGDVGPGSIGIDIDWVDATSVGYLANYLDGIGFKAVKSSNGSVGFLADWSKATATGTAFDINLGNSGDFGLDISGTAGTGIQTTRPILINGITAMGVSEEAITINTASSTAIEINSVFGRGIYFSNYDGGHNPWIYGDLGPNATGIDINWVAPGSVGYYADEVEGIGMKFDSVNYSSSTMAYMDLTGSGSNVRGLDIDLGVSGAKTAIDLTLGNSGDFGLNITGTTGTGIYTTRPIKIASSTAFTSEYPLEIVMTDGGYGQVFSNGLSSAAYGIYFPGNVSGGASALIMEGTITGNSVGIYMSNQISDGSRGLEMGGIEGTGTGIMMYLGGYTGDAGRGMELTFSNNATGGNEGIGLDILMGDKNALNKGINISGTVGIGIQTTRPIDLETMSNKPTCDATVRGQIFYIEGGAGVADTAEICTKDVSDVYAWRTLQ